MSDRETLEAQGAAKPAWPKARPSPFLHGSGVVVPSPFLLWVVRCPPLLLWASVSHLSIFAVVAPANLHPPLSWEVVPSTSSSFFSSFLGGGGRKGRGGRRAAAIPLLVVSAASPFGWWCCPHSLLHFGGDARTLPPFGLS